jgi:hypothetical protein
MPTHDGLGVNQERVPALARQEPAGRSQQCAIAHPVDRALHLTAKDGDLVAKDEILKLDLPGSAIPGRQDTEQSTKHHVEERGEHDRDSVMRGRQGTSGARESDPEGTIEYLYPMPSTASCATSC